jgi:hypothetical protein
MLNTAHSLFVFSAHWKLFGGVKTNSQKLLRIRFALAVFFLKVTDNFAVWIHGILCISLLLTVLFVIATVMALSAAGYLWVAVRKGVLRKTTSIRHTKSAINMP